jgi:putative hemolysin
VRVSYTSISSFLTTLVIALFAGLLAGLALLLAPLPVPLLGASQVGGVLIAVPVLGLAVLFAAAETAVAAIRRARVQQLVEEGVRGARSLQRLLENSVGLVATIRVIVITATVAANTLLVVLLRDPLVIVFGAPGPAYAVITLLVLLVALVVVDQMGHAFGLRHAEQVALGLAQPARVAVVALWPLVKGLGALGDLVYQRDGAAQRETAGITEAGIMLQVDVAEEEGVLEEEEGEMIRSIFEFGDTVAREIMVPRIDIQAADVTMSLNEAVDLAIEEGHSRVPIYEGTVDRILGIFYVKDSLRFLRQGRLDVDVREIIRPAYFVPETKKVDELLREMQKRRVHVAVVVDEYGGTAGLVTIEDILEEIVGEIQDEFDTEEAMVEQVNEYESIVDAMMTLSDVNDALSLHLDEEDVDTLGGYVYARLGRVPEEGDEVHEELVSLVVEEVEGNRITRVRVVRHPADGGAGSGGSSGPTGGANSGGAGRTDGSIGSISVASGSAQTAPGDTAGQSRERAD